MKPLPPRWTTAVWQYNHRHEIGCALLIIAIAASFGLAWLLIELGVAR